MAWFSEREGLWMQRFKLANASPGAWGYQTTHFPQTVAAEGIYPYVLVPDLRNSNTEPGPEKDPGGDLFLQFTKASETLEERQKYPVPLILGPMMLMYDSEVRPYELVMQQKPTAGYTCYLTWVLNPFDRSRLLFCEAEEGQPIVIRGQERFFYFARERDRLAFTAAVDLYAEHLALGLTPPTCFSDRPKPYVGEPDFSTEVHAYLPTGDTIFTPLGYWVAVTGGVPPFIRFTTDESMLRMVGVPNHVNGWHEFASCESILLLSTTVQEPIVQEVEAPYLGFPGTAQSYGLRYRMLRAFDLPVDLREYIRSDLEYARSRRRISSAFVTLESNERDHSVLRHDSHPYEVLLGQLALQEEGGPLSGAAIIHAFSPDRLQELFCYFFHIARAMKKHPCEPVTCPEIISSHGRLIPENYDGGYDLQGVPPTLYGWLLPEGWKERTAPVTLPPK